MVRSTCSVSALMPAPRCPSSRRPATSSPPACPPAARPASGRRAAPRCRARSPRRGADRCGAAATPVLGQRRRHRQLQRRLADVVGRVRQQRARKSSSSALAGARADGDAVAAEFADRLHHQLGPADPACRPAPSARGRYASRRSAGSASSLEVVTDDPRHVGVHRLVVGHAGADRVGQRHVARAPGARSARARPACCRGGTPSGSRKSSSDAAVDRVHRRAARRWCASRRGRSPPRGRAPSTSGTPISRARKTCSK